MTEHSHDALDKNGGDSEDAEHGFIESVPPISVMYAADDGSYMFDVGAEDQNMRLDAFLARHFEDVSRSRLQKAIKEGHCQINESVNKQPSTKIKAEDSIRLEIEIRTEITVLPEDIPLDIVFEDDHVLVLNKQTGLVVHPGAGNPDGTLVNALMHYCGAENLASIGAPLRPGIVHRLDKDTSGLMVVAKTDKAYYKLAEQLADRSLTRIYKAFVWGVPDLVKGAVDHPIGRHPTQRHKMAVNRRQGKDARTKYTVVKKYDPCASLVECQLETGRTHQIRVHMAYLGFFLVGDQQYGAQPTSIQSKLNRGHIAPEAQERLLNLPHQALQATFLSFLHPETDEKVDFEVPVSDYLREIDSLLKTTD